jgi:hypothetical protein
VENRFNDGIAVFRGGSWHGEFLCTRLLFVVLVPLFDFTDLRQELARDGRWGLFPIAASAESPTTES